MERSVVRLRTTVGPCLTQALARGTATLPQRAWLRLGSSPSCCLWHNHTNKVAELIDQVGAIYSVHSRVKCSNKNLWTSASCFNFSSFEIKKKRPMSHMELRGLKKKR